MLHALALAFPDVEYCQGMNFVAAALISVAESEETGFWLFTSLMIKFEMRGLYLPGVPDLHLRNYMMSQVIKQQMPKLSSHFRRIQMATDYFTSKWVMTLYSNFLPDTIIPQIFDNIFLDSWSAVYKVAVALLKDMEETFLEMDMVEMSIYL